MEKEEEEEKDWFGKEKETAKKQLDDVNDAHKASNSYSTCKYLVLRSLSLTPRGENKKVVQNTKPQTMCPLCISAISAPLTPPRVNFPNQTTNVARSIPTHCRGTPPEIDKTSRKPYP